MQFFASLLPHLWLRKTASRRRRRVLGFTLIEMLMVVVMGAIIMAIGLRKTKTVRDQASVRAAKQQFNAYLAAARAAAIRQSLQGQFYIKSHAISATVTQSTGTRLTIGNSIALDAARGVAVTLAGATANDSVLFDPRGFGTTSSNAAKTYVFTKNSAKDSVCISKMGLIARFCGQ